MRAADLEGRRCIVPQGTLLRPAPGGVRMARPLAAEAEGTIVSFGIYGNAEREVGITGIPGAERQVLYANLADVRVLASRAVNR